MELKKSFQVSCRNNAHRWVFSVSNYFVTQSDTEVTRRTTEVFSSL